VRCHGIEWNDMEERGGDDGRMYLLILIGRVVGSIQIIKHVRRVFAGVGGLLTQLAPWTVCGRICGCRCVGGSGGPCWGFIARPKRRRSRPRAHEAVDKVIHPGSQSRIAVQSIGGPGRCETIRLRLTPRGRYASGDVHSGDLRSGYFRSGEVCCEDVRSGAVRGFDGGRSTKSAVYSMVM
jgi:hypothetical protein